MTVTITKEDFLTAIDEAIAIKGEDYVYEYTDILGGCRYSTKDGEPSCLIGFVIAKLAPEVFAQIAQLENSWGESCGISEFFGCGWEHYSEHGVERILGEELGFEFESDTLLRAAQAAQSTQDVGRTWASAREEALGELSL